MANFDQPYAERHLPTADSRFDGWHLYVQEAPGVVQHSTIDALPATDTAPCDRDHAIQRAASYQVTSPEVAEVLCVPCVLHLVDGAATGGYVIGVLSD